MILPDPKHPLFEESIIVFRLKKTDSVLPRLLELAHQREHDYEAIAGNRVYWVFREVLEVQETMTNKGLVDGTEVYYRWWHNPGPRASKLMRETQTEPWWLEE